MFSALGREQPPAAQPWLNRPMSRGGCLAGCLVWLVVMTLPLAALLLAVRGELAWRRGPFAEDRLWLVGAQQPADGRGLAYSASRLIRRPGLPAGAVCVRTRVYFWMWQGRSEALSYCDCYQPAAEGGYLPAGSCP